MNEKSTSDDGNVFEEWHLTALALGELSPELAASTQQRIDADPELARQYAEIQSTLALLATELKSVRGPEGLDLPRRDEVMAQMRSKAPSGPGARPAVDEASRAWRWRIAGAAGLAALAASVMLMLQWTGSPDAGMNAGGQLSWKEQARTAGEVSGPAGPSFEPQTVENLPERIAGSPAGRTDSVADASSADVFSAEKTLAESAPAELAPAESAPTQASSLKTAKAPGKVPGGMGGMGGMGFAGGGGGKFGGTFGGGAMRGVAESGGTVVDERKLSRSESDGYAGFGEGRDPLQGQLPDVQGQLPDELRANVPSMNRRKAGVGDRFDAIPETPFADVIQQPLSTFSIDVDTASYSKLRQYVLEQQTLPSSETIRIEEWINYFDYAYPGPRDDSPFAAHIRLVPCPWNTDHKLVRVAIAAKKPPAEQRPSSNLVFLIDVSGSMSDSNKLPLVKRTLQLLVSQLREQDRVAIVVYAGAAGCVLPSTSGANKDAILASINELQSGGSTNGGQGIQLAYKIAKEHFIADGINRVILCTDGDFNVGVTGNDQLVAMMRENAQSNIFLTLLGYGIGNYNDSMMEQVSNQGNGIYAMIDSELEAKRVMVEQLAGTLMTVAKDVKLQIEFNPVRIASYRLIGYENRRLATKDFADDGKDAGEIGAGHSVTALYEVIPAGSADSIPGSTELRYAKRRDFDTAKTNDADVPPELAMEWLQLKIRSKKPEASESTLQTFTLRDSDEDSYAEDRRDMDWASSVAEFGLLLRRSQLAAGADWDRMLSRASESAGSDPYRRECLVIMQQSRRLMGR
ncbi:MAG: von Willebrand factor type A domain-containing protein [Planctomycetota bacterium]